MVGPSSIFECGLLALRLLHFDEFHTSSSVNMRNATAVLVGPSNLPLFGPQGKHHGFEDSVCYHIWSTTSPRRTDNSACQGCKIILTRLSELGILKEPSRYALTTLHTWVMVGEMGLEPICLAAEVFETSLYNIPTLAQIKRTRELQSPRRHHRSLTLDFGRIFLG